MILEFALSGPRIEAKRGILTSLKPVTRKVNLIFRIKRLELLHKSLHYRS